MLQVHHLSKSYGNKIILDDVSFTAEKGEIIGLVAPNGTGKTTLLNIIMNFTRPNSGNVTLMDTYDYSSKKNELNMHKHISFLPEMDDLYEELSGVDHLNLYGNLWNKTNKQIKQVVEALNMGQYVKKPVGTYSLGMKQRLCFAMLLAADTEVMLMDEVMNGLDPDNVKLLTGLLVELKKQGKTILIASHLLENLDLYADRVLFLKDGKIVMERLEKTKPLYLKVTANPKEYREVLRETTLPINHQYLSSRLLCLPVASMSEPETSEWITFFLKRKLVDLSIGEIGTAEWYSEFYGEPIAEGVIK